MISVQQESNENIVYAVASETLTQQDYDRLLPKVEETLHHHDKIRLYFEMKDFSGWTPGAAWQDVKFDFGHASDFEKIAMVGNKSWENWLTQLMKPFTSAEVRYFEPEQKETAKTWIKN